jgi:hypothetical protein
MQYIKPPKRISYTDIDRIHIVGDNRGKTWCGRYLAHYKRFDASPAIPGWDAGLCRTCHRVSITTRATS